MKLSVPEEALIKSGKRPVNMPKKLNALMLRGEYKMLVSKAILCHLLYHVAEKVRHLVSASHRSLFSQWMAPYTRFVPNVDDMRQKAQDASAN